MKNWSGNSKSIYVTMGASNHTNKEREKDDYYATDPNALRIFLDKLENDGIVLHKDIWECACGEGHLSKVLKSKNYNVYSTDLVNRGYEDEKMDFLKVNTTEIDADILTNPPYKFAKEFVKKL